MICRSPRRSTIESWCTTATVVVGGVVGGVTLVDVDVDVDVDAAVVVGARVVVGVGAVVFEAGTVVVAAGATVPALLEHAEATSNAATATLDCFTDRVCQLSPGESGATSEPR